MREIIAEITKGYSNRQEKNYLRYEADFIYHSLKNTDKSPKSIHNNYVENSMDYSDEKILKNSHFLGLKNPKVRESCYKDSNEIIKTIEDSELGKEIDLKSLNLLHKSSYKGALLILLRDKKNRDIENFVHKLNLKESKNVIVKIIESLQKKNTKDIEVEILGNNNKTGENEKNITKEEIINQFFTEVENCKIVQLNELKVEKEKTENKDPQSIKDEVLIKFFSDINSGRTDYILDKLNELVIGFEKNDEIGKEFFILKNLFKFFKLQGLVPIKTFGTEFVGKLKDIEDGEYQGTEFIDCNDEKKIRIERSGWKYKNKIISNICYREVGNKF